MSCQNSGFNRDSGLNRDKATVSPIPNFEALPFGRITAPEIPFLSPFFTEEWSIFSKTPRIVFHFANRMASGRWLVLATMATFF